MRQEQSPHPCHSRPSLSRGFHTLGFLVELGVLKQEHLPLYLPTRQGLCPGRDGCVSCLCINKAWHGFFLRNSLLKIQKRHRNSTVQVHQKSSLSAASTLKTVLVLPGGTGFSPWCLSLRSLPVCFDVRGPLSLAPKYSFPTELPVVEILVDGEESCHDELSFHHTLDIMSS